MIWTRKKKTYLPCDKCQKRVERITPNQKRCTDCALQIGRERARAYALTLSVEEKRGRFKKWYYQNLIQARSERLAYYHKKRSK